MKVFLAGIIQGSLSEATIHDQDWRTPIKRILAEHRPDIDVYCHYSVHPNSITYQLPEIKATLTDGFDRSADCDLLIAYLPSASMGTAIEIYLAAQNNAIVLTISPMAPNWVLRAYSDRIFPDMEAFEQFIAAGGLDELTDQSNRTNGDTPGTE
jgi:hypothetical protein